MVAQVGQAAKKHVDRQTSSKSLKVGAIEHTHAHDLASDYVSAGFYMRSTHFSHLNQLLFSWS